MFTSEIKIKTHGIIDDIPDEILKDLIPFLEKIRVNTINTQQIELAKLIIADNKLLLQRLAQ